MDYQKAVEAKNLLSGQLLASQHKIIRAFGLESVLETSHNLMQPPAIAGIGIGREGLDDYHMRILLQKPLSEEEVKALMQVLEVEESDLRLVATDRIRALNGPVQTRQRPLPYGISIGHNQVSAGTLGGVVYDEGKPFWLSNNHVFANGNAATPGDAIWQPGSRDGGTEQDQVAALARFVPIDFSGSNEVDAALAEPLDNSLISTNFPPSNPVLAAITGITVPTYGMEVVKYGRTTGFTKGKIVSLTTDLPVSFGQKQAYFVDQLEIESERGGTFSQPGDSGSLILQAGTGLVVGLLFAGDGNLTFANPIAQVLKALNVTFG